MIDIREVAPTDPRLQSLIERHLELMYASSPACSIHAMDASRLAEAGARFFAVFDGDVAIAMGALKSLQNGQGELKSMHVHADHRGAGLADAILSKLLSIARDEGMVRVNLETGSQDAFAAARAFYAKHAFETCPPFEGYAEDPNSVFMTRAV